MRRNMWVAVLGLLVVLVVVGLGGCSTGGPGEPRVTDGMLIGDAFGGLFFPSPDGQQAVMFEGESWCIADLPAPDAIDDELPVTVGVLSPGNPELRCSDSPVSPDASPRWSPDGSRIVASDLEQAKVYVLDPSSLEIETTLDVRGNFPIWVSETEILLYYGAEAQAVWYVESVEGDERRQISAPHLAGLDPVLVDDSTVVYLTIRREAMTDPEAVEIADLIELDWKAGTTTELAPMQNLNAGGQIPDPGVVTDMTSDLRYAVLWAQTKANEGQGPNVYVYDLESETLIAHTPPGLDPQTLAFLPFLVGDAWVAYTATADDSDAGYQTNVYIAPLDDPSAAIELFQDGLLVDVTNDRLTIAAASEGLAILDIDF